MLLPSAQGQLMNEFDSSQHRKCSCRHRARVPCLPLRIKRACESNHFAAGSIPRCVRPVGSEHRGA